MSESGSFSFVSWKNIHHLHPHSKFFWNLGRAGSKDNSSSGRLLWQNGQKWRKKPWLSCKGLMKKIFTLLRASTPLPPPILIYISFMNLSEDHWIQVTAEELFQLQDSPPISKALLGKKMGLFFTCSEVFFKRINFPSTSISSMQTFPVAEAEWEMLTLLLASDSSTSTLFRFPLVVRTLRLEDARDTVTREEGLGESFNLYRKSRTYGLWNVYAFLS